MSWRCRHGWHRWALDGDLIVEHLRAMAADPTYRPPGVPQRCMRCDARQIWRPLPDVDRSDRA